MIESCISCATGSSSYTPPGGIVFETPKWMVVLRANPVRFPCLPLSILKRHIEDMARLDQEESYSLGQIMQLTARVLSHVWRPAKVHFGIYAEEIRHIRIHVFSRMPDMPLGNISSVGIGPWMNFLHALGLKRAYSDEIVAPYADKLRQAYLQFTHTEQETL
jgi:diadenosine tetraphosphate (Ap4A) HIT family hydrolase